MESLLQDIRYGFRSLGRNRTFTAAVLLTLAFGIGANTAIFTLVDAALLRLMPVRDPRQLYLLGSRTSMSMIRADGPGERSDSFLSYPLYRDLRNHSEVFSDLAALSSFYINVYVGGDAAAPGAAVEKAEARLVSGNFFSLLGVGASLGRAFAEEDDTAPGKHPVAILSHGYWTRRFGGDPSVLGRTIRINGLHYSVIGVAADGFSGVTPGLATDLWVPLMMQSQIMQSPPVLGDRNVMWLRAIGRIKAGVTPALAADRTRTLFHQLLQEETGSSISPDIDRSISRLKMDLVPFGRGMGSLRELLASPLVVLMGVVALVLLIACANVGNLLLARGSSRQREAALRHALGASRARLLRQCLTESLLLALGGGLVALFATLWTKDLLLAFFFRRALQLQVNSRVLAFTLGVSLFTAVIFGLAPALRATRIDLAASLHNQSAAAGFRPAGGRLRRSLVVAQVSISLILLVTAGLFIRSLQNLRREEPGFRARGVLMVELDPQGGGYSREEVPRLYEKLLERIRSLPGVDSASMSYFGLFSGARRNNAVTIRSYSPQSEEDLGIQETFVTPAYFETLGIPILLGRSFKEADRVGSPRVAIVNETFARHYFGSASPVGRRFGVDGEGSEDDIEIVGVAKDLKYNDLREETPRYAYYPAFQRVNYLNSLELRTGRDPSDIIPEVRRALTEADKNLPVLDVTTLDQQIAGSLRGERMIGRLTGFFGLLALFLASLGLYGIMAWGVARRTGEIGIRLALGADRSQVMRMVLGDTLVIAGCGIVIGIAGAAAATRFVSSLLFGLEPTDPLTILAAASVLFLTAALAGFVPAWRASRLDPAAALRHE